MARKRLPTPKNLPPGTPWKVTCARTRAARAAADRAIAGVRLPPGPAMVLAATGRAPTLKEFKRLTRKDDAE